MKHLAIVTLASALVACCLFLLSGCSLFGDVTPTPAPTPTENIVPAPQQFVLPSVPCEKAVQLILQKQVSIVRFWYAPGGGDVFFGISIVQPGATPVPGALPAGVPGSDDIDVYSGSEYTPHRTPTAECQAQIRAAIKQVNATLPTSQQVKVERKTTYS